MAIKEYLRIKFSLETLNGLPVMSVTPELAYESLYDEYDAGMVEIPADSNWYQISHDLIGAVQMALLDFQGVDLSFRLNDDANLVLDCSDFWLFRSTATPITKLEAKNDGGDAVSLKYYLLGT